MSDKRIPLVAFISKLFKKAFITENTGKRTHRVTLTNNTYLICFYRACAIRLHRDARQGSWCASLIRLARVGTKQHTAEVGYFWLISTLHPRTS